jgi:PAS domain S-box-containing protein
MQQNHNLIDLSYRDRLPEKLARAKFPFSAFAGALASSGFGLTQADPETRRYTYANAAFCSMIGYSLDELIGGNLTFADLIDPDDSAGHVGEFLRLVRGEIDSCTVDNRYIRKDGSVVPARAVISALERDSTNRAVVTMGIIIPLQSRSDEPASAISGVSFWTRDLRTRKGFCSASFRSLLGLPPDVPCPSFEDLLDYVHPEDRRRLTEEVERASKGSFQSSRYRIVRPSGELSWISQSAKPIFDASSHVIGIVAACMDFTEATRPPDTTPSFAAAAATVKTVKQFVDLHWNRPLSVNDLAQAADVTARTLFKRFKLACGFTPQEYIKWVRLQHAREMLQRADKSTTVLGISLRCSFQNQGHFARDYRLAFGERPSDTLARARRPLPCKRSSNEAFVG